MKIIRWLVNFLAGATAIFVSLYLIISICILFFKLTGQLSDGPMYFDMQTPIYGGLFLFQAFSIAIILVCLAVRITFGQKDDLAFLRRVSNVKSWNE